MKMPIYVPILKAMKSETIALQYKESSDFKNVVPLFEVARINDQIRSAKRFEGVPDLELAYLNEVIEKIISVWHGRQAMVDMFHWEPNSKLSSGVHVIDYLNNNLFSKGIDVIPVIGYDRWDFTEYRVALQNLELPNVPYYCLRLEQTAFEDMNDKKYFQSNIKNILHDLNLDAKNCAVMLDFGDISKRSLDQISETVDEALNILKAYEFKFFITAGCSIPPSVNLAVKDENSEGKIQRKEMLLWQDKTLNHSSVKIVYGDYGVRGPNSNEGSIAPDANGKIRYTIEKHFFIVRGYSMRKGVKGEQMWELAKRLMSTVHYKNPQYSWGDGQIEQCALKLIKGGHSEWISHDTNHHLYFVLEEITDFLLSGIYKKSAV